MDFRNTPIGDASFFALRLIFAVRYHAARKPRGGACQPSPADDNGGGSFPGAARLPPKNGIAHFSWVALRFSLRSNAQARCGLSPLRRLPLEMPFFLPFFQSPVSNPCKKQAMALKINFHAIAFTFYRSFFCLQKMGLLTSRWGCARFARARRASPSVDSRWRCHFYSKKTYILLDKKHIAYYVIFFAENSVNFKNITELHGGRLPQNNGNVFRL